MYEELTSNLGWRLRHLLHRLGAWLPSAGDLPHAPRVLLYCPGGVGDGVMCLPVLKTLRAALPRAELVLVAPPVTIELATGLAQGAIQSAGSLAHLLRQVRRAGPFDVFLGAVQSVHGATAQLLALASRAPVRLGSQYPGEAWRPPRGLWSGAVEIDPRRHDVLHNLCLLERLGIAPSRWEPAPAVALTEDERTDAARRLAALGIDRAEPILGVHPGSDRRYEHKRWLPDRLLSVVEQAGRRWGAHTLLFEGPDELGLAAGLAERLERPASVVREPSIRVVAGLIGRCWAFLSCDSGLGHLAGALAVPTVSLMGPASPEQLAPWGQRSHALWAGLPCSPCIATGPCADVVKPCMAAIEMDQVLDALAAVLAPGLRGA
ncbi:MAG: glycosyltransferase family 9 protein [Planctomycetes bacterium]|nr:glycosyltransferase family 9 protein [Planctomycetota bacterium]